jgi:hypothetical protein
MLSISNSEYNNVLNVTIIQKGNYKVEFLEQHGVPTKARVGSGPMEE